tara:strand:+ start:192 stop:950 length:759 start_codon:yes stop_codon:yes gene_type:complete
MMFNREDKERLTDLLYDYFDAQSDWLAGQYRGYLDNGLPARRALKRTRRDFFRLVADELDSKCTWSKVRNREVRASLEAIDGFVFNAVMNGLLNVATARILGTGTGFAGLLAVADDAIGAAREALEPDPEPPSEQPTVIGRPRTVEPVVPIPDWMPSRVDEAEEAIEETGAAVDGGSAAAVKDRLTDLLKTDRAVLGDPRAEDLMGPGFEPDPDTDEEEEPLRRRLPSMPTGRLFGLGGVLSSFRKSSGGDE